MSVRGDARHASRPIYRPPPVVGPTNNRYASATTNPPAWKPAVLHEQGAVRHPNPQMFPRTTAAAADDSGFRASAREAALAAQLLDVRAKARNEHAHAIRLIEEMNAEVLACRQRTDAAEKRLMVVSVSRRFNAGIFPIFLHFSGTLAVAIAAATAAAERRWLVNLHASATALSAYLVPGIYSILSVASPVAAMCFRATVRRS